MSRDDPLLAQTVGAQLIVRVKARAIFPNCPRYIPKLQLAEPSKYVPQPGRDPVEPAWKGFDDFKDYVHPRQPTFRARAGQIDLCSGDDPWQACLNQSTNGRADIPAQSFARST